MWNQVYNPLNNATLSTLAAAVPVVTLLVLIASGKVKAHIAAIIALVVANIITIAVYHMPANMSVRASLLGVVAGFFPIGWIVLNVIFLYQVTVSTGRFELLKRAVGGVTEDRRLQLLLIAFSFGAFFEGASGFGTPVAITTGVTYEVSIWTPLRYVATGSFSYPTSGTNLTAPSPNGYFTSNTPVLVMAATQSGASYFADVVFAVGGGVSPTGLAIPITFGTPTVALNRTAAPTGLSVPIAFGSPAAGITVQPNGFAIPLAFGAPRVGPTVLSATQGSWWGLKAVAVENREYARQQRSQEPLSCPNDGEPLQRGTDGKLRCRYDGWTWRGFGQG